MNPRTPTGQAPQACASKTLTERVSLTWLGNSREQSPVANPGRYKALIGFPPINARKEISERVRKNV